MQTIDRVCPTCGKTFQADLKYVKQGEAKFCSRSCVAIHFNGKRPPAKNKKHLNRIARDAYIAMFGQPVCMMCGNRKADVHHRDGDRRNNDPANLQPLCRSCHIAHHNSQRGLMKIERERGTA